MTSFTGFIPTPAEQVDIFLELAELSDSDVVYDLGSGDGRLLFAAMEKGVAGAVGIELNEELVLGAAETARSKDVHDMIEFQAADVMEVDLSEASVVFCYLSVQASAALKPKLESELEPGARVVMEMYPVPGWKSARTIDNGGKRFYLYVMPPEPGLEDADRDPLLDYLNHPPDIKRDKPAG